MLAVLALPGMAVAPLVRDEMGLFDADTYNELEQSAEAASSGHDCDVYFLVVNDGSGSYAATSRATLISNVNGSCGATVYPMFNAAGTYLGFQWDGQRISDGLPYANSANLELEANTSGVNILPGTSVSFYGRK